MRTPCIGAFLISPCKKWFASNGTGDEKKCEKVKNNTKRFSEPITYLRPDDAVMRYSNTPCLHYPCLPVFHYSIHSILYYTSIPYVPYRVILINPLDGCFQL